MSQNHWATQSPVTEPGPAGKVIDELPDDLAALRQASSQLVFHYRAGGDFTANGVPAERVAEIDTRYADLMLDRILERGAPTLARARPPADRVVGCCRDSTVLFLALARHKEIPARARVGFAAYFHPGWLADHVVAEVWDEREGRWRLVDAEMDAAWTPEVNGRPVDWLDLTADQFVTGPRAWQAARAGISDPERHIVAPGLDIPALRGWPYIAHNVVHDLTALNKTEMLLWDGWGMQLGIGPGPVPAADATVLDEVSAATADSGIPPSVLAEFGSRDGLRVPPVVTSFDPGGGPERQVDVSRALGADPARASGLGLVSQPLPFGIIDFRPVGRHRGVRRRRHLPGPGHPRLPAHAPHARRGRAGTRWRLAGHPCVNEKFTITSEWL